ncbi:MAG: hypothetical protein P8Q92_09180 [Pseudoprimorskyibacter sp.]|nr:hypothetical protein [Pseudoprimorskyibacter sp.]
MLVKTILGKNPIHKVITKCAEEISESEVSSSTGELDVTWRKTVWVSLMGFLIFFLAFNALKTLLGNSIESRLINEFSGLGADARVSLFPKELPKVQQADGYSLSALNFGSYEMAPTEVLRKFLLENDHSGLYSMRIVVRNNSGDWVYSEAIIEACGAGECSGSNQYVTFAPSTSDAWISNLTRNSVSKNLTLHDEVEAGTRFQVLLRVNLNRDGKLISTTVFLRRYYNSIAWNLIKSLSSGGNYVAEVPFTETLIH